MAPSSLSSVVSTDSIEGGWGDSSSPSVSAPTPGSTVWSAAIRFVQKEAGLSSVWSSDSHATVALSGEMAASQSASSVVLPKPTGAATRVSFDFGRAVHAFAEPGRGTDATPPTGARRTSFRAMHRS